MRIYTGPRGSGKTSHAVNDAFKRLGQRRNNYVIANFGLKFTKRQLKKGYGDRFIYIPNEGLTPHKLMELSARYGWYKKEGATLLIIDEAGLKFNSRDWQIKGTDRMAWIDFFVNSRKLGYDPLLIAQFIKMVDRQIREIIEHEVKHARLNNLHFFTWLPLPVFVTITKWLIGDFRPKVRFHFLNYFTARAYDTMLLFNPKVIEIIKQYEVVETPEPAEDGGEGVPSDSAARLSRLKQLFVPKALE